jgi:hypothetical protein
MKKINIFIYIYSMPKKPKDSKKTKNRYRRLEKAKSFIKKKSARKLSFMRKKSNARKKPNARKLSFMRKKPNARKLSFKKGRMMAKDFDGKTAMRGARVVAEKVAEQYNAEDLVGPKTVAVAEAVGNAATVAGNAATQAAIKHGPAILEGGQAAAAKTAEFIQPVATNIASGAFEASKYAVKKGGPILGAAAGAVAKGAYNAGKYAATGVANRMIGPSENRESSENIEEGWDMVDENREDESEPSDDTDEPNDIHRLLDALSSEKKQIVYDMIVQLTR